LIEGKDGSPIGFDVGTDGSEIGIIEGIETPLMVGFIDSDISGVEIGLIIELLV
jgi:hypothetical protein